MLTERGSGILLHLSSLPSPFGIGDLGEGAYRFADFLAAAGQRYWQILPVHPTNPVHGHSPYMSPSAFAGNPLFISPLGLVREGLLTAAELGAKPPFRPGAVDYRGVVAFREPLLATVRRRFPQRAGREMRLRLEAFCLQSEPWLEDYALFRALKRRYRDSGWSEWPPEIRDRQEGALAAARKALAHEMERERLDQFLFFEQWRKLKRYCNERRIRIIGDMPIYVAHDSADVWAHPGLFHLDADRRPALLSGVPPAEPGGAGQFWGHPLYRWGAMKKSGYGWMIARIAHQAALFDHVRIDHFRGFVNYWEIPATARTAERGRWVAAPAYHFFSTLAKNLPSLPLVCEDLGVSPPDFREEMDHFGLPGMRVLQFGFDRDPPGSPHAPHNYPANCVAYSGTHDNGPLRGWYETAAKPREKKALARYLGRRIAPERLHWELIRLLMMSAARIVLIPMQDLLGLGEKARMNRPGTAEGNWGWRVTARRLTGRLAGELQEITAIYGRGPSGGPTGDPPPRSGQDAAARTAGPACRGCRARG